MYDPLLMTARENELAEKLEARTAKLEATASEGRAATFTPDLLRKWAQQDRLAASTLRANAERIKALEEALESAIAELVDMSNARWSEYEGTEDDLVGGYREVLGAKQ